MNCSSPDGGSNLLNDSTSYDKRPLSDFFWNGREPGNIKILESNNIWHAHGIFKACPSLLQQIFTIQAIVNNQAVPLVYVLAQNQSQEQYIRKI